MINRFKIILKIKKKQTKILISKKAQKFDYKRFDKIIQKKAQNRN